MSAFKVKLSLQGFSLELEGTREDIPLMTEQVGNQVASMLRPAAAIAMGEVPRAPALVATVTSVAAKAGGRRRRASTGGTSGEQERVEWKHETERWGAPQQSWPVLDKLAWILHVLHEAGVPALTPPRIVEAFNTNFHDAGRLDGKHILRDLRRLRAAVPALADENREAKPPTWTLTQSGRARATVLIASTKSRASAAS